MAGLIDSIADNFESLIEWFFKLLNTQDKETMRKISVVLEAIWRQRNDQYWNGSHASTEKTVYLALECLFDWISIQESTRAGSQVTPWSVQQR